MIVKENQGLLKRFGTWLDRQDNAPNTICVYFRDFQRVACIFFMVSMIMASISCSPMTEQEEEFFQQRKERREQQEMISTVLEGSTRQAEAMTMVKEQEAPDKRGTVEEWLERAILIPGAKIMFPRWKVLPRGKDKYEVRFEYTAMKEGFEIEKRGYSWNVDLVLKIVSPYRELELDAPGRSLDRSEASQQQRRRRATAEEVFSLE